MSWRARLPWQDKHPGGIRLLFAALVCLFLTFPFADFWQRSSPVASSKNTWVSLSSPAHAAPSRSLNSVQNRQSAPYRLARLFDGDSFELTDRLGRRVSVRLYGVDAPEKDQPFGDASRRHLYKLMKGHSFRVQPLYRDKYDRHVALVYRVENGAVDRVSLNQHQVRAGMAWVYERYCTGGFCRTWKKEESNARKKRLGLWKDSSPIQPELWRHYYKN